LRNRAPERGGNPAAQLLVATVERHVMRHLLTLAADHPLATLCCRPASVEADAQDRRCAPRTAVKVCCPIVASVKRPPCRCRTTPTRPERPLRRRGVPKNPHGDRSILSLQYFSDIVVRSIQTLLRNPRPKLRREEEPRFPRIPGGPDYRPRWIRERIDQSVCDSLPS
jgi:hypothetical protein